MGLADRGLAAELAGMRNMIRDAVEKGTPEALDEAEGLRMMYQLSSPDAATWSPERRAIWDEAVNTGERHLLGAEGFDDGVWMDNRYSVVNGQALALEDQLAEEFKKQAVMGEGPFAALTHANHLDPSGIDDDFDRWVGVQQALRQESRARTQPLWDAYPGLDVYAPRQWRAEVDQLEAQRRGLTSAPWLGFDSITDDDIPF